MLRCDSLQSAAGFREAKWNAPPAINKRLSKKCFEFGKLATELALAVRISASGSTDATGVCDFEKGTQPLERKTGSGEQVFGHDHLDT